MERSPISAYRRNPPDYPNQAAMSYASGPYTQNLIPNSHYSAHRAVEKYHRMHPSQNAWDLAMGYQSPRGPNPSHVLPVTPTERTKVKCQNNFTIASAHNNTWIWSSWIQF
jgi:hypothetical protein